MELAYRATTGADPHLIRRALLLRRYPEIRALRGWDARPVARVAGVLAVQLGIGGALEQLAHRVPWWASGIAVVITAYAIGAILAHYGGVVIHEAAHDLCAPTPRLNRCIAIFANLVQGVPYAMSFRRHHMTHHVHIGVVGIDNDLPHPVEQRVISNSPWRKLGWLLVYPLVGGALRGYLARPNRWEVINLVVVIAFDVLVVVALGPIALFYLLLAGLLSASLHPVAGHFIHEHYLWDDGQETYSYYGPLNRVTENMGYHVEHHDFMDVPGSRLPELHRIAAREYGALISHRSWTAILWRFVTDPRLSHYSRFVRRPEHLRGRALRTMPDGGALQA